VRRAFALTPRVLDLGLTYLSTIPVTQFAQPFLEEIVDRLHESSSIGVLDAHDCVYVARRPAKRIMSVNLVDGSRLPAHATSMGKVLLAALPAESLDQYFAAGPLQRLTKRTICDQSTLRRELAAMRKQGWALADQETEAGVVHAALNVGSHADRVPLRTLERDFLRAPGPAVC
jgi:IclR family transcriptional regulator, pca regulon regulatory protein